MRFQQLEYFQAARKFGSLRRAAEELGVSQPSLSEQLRRLEEELNITLFLRSRTGVSATEAAEALVPHVEVALAAQEAIRQEADTLADLRRGTVRLGMVSVAGGRGYRNALQRFAQAYPAVQFEVVETGSNDICDRVRSGDLDAGVVVTLGVKRPDGLRCSHVASGRLSICVSTHSQFAERRDVSVEDLATVPFITHSRAYVLRDAFEELGDEQALVTVHSTDNHDTMNQLVCDGLGISLSSGLDAERQEAAGGVKVVPLSDPGLSTALTIVSREDEQLPPPAREFIRMLQAIWKEARR